MPDERVAEATSIQVLAEGDRTTLEALYLEVRELAKQYGLKVEYSLNQGVPEENRDR